MRERTGLSPGLVRVMERKFKGLPPGKEYFVPLQHGRNTVGYAVFGVYGGRPTMKTVLGPHMRPNGTELEGFQVKTGDMMKYAFELGAAAGMEKSAKYSRLVGAGIGAAAGAGAGAAVGRKKNRRRNMAVGALLGAAGGYAAGGRRAGRAPKHDIAKERSALDKGWDDLLAKKELEAKAQRELLAKERASEAKKMVDHKAKMKSFESFMKSDKPLVL